MENIKTINLPSNVKLILKRLLDNNFEAYAVGGCVRDSILNRPVADYDITTSALPEDVISIFHDYEVIETGLQHGTVTIMIEHEGFEITTFRIDGEYKDNRRPDSVTYTTNLKADLRRRDFTINALACDIDGNIIDMFNGIEDLNNRIVRCVGSADARFNEDGLRILRALRFAAKLDFDIEFKTAEAIRNNKDLIRNIAQERIQKEFNGIISCYNITSACRLIDSFLEVFGVFIPEILAMRMNQNNKYHKHNDLLDHTLAVVAGTKPDLILRLAAFFHDFGKPDTYTVEILENGIQGHFYGHPKVSAEKTFEIMKRMKYSNDEIEAVVWLVENHDNMIAATKRSVKKVLNKTKSPELFDILIELKASDRADHVNLSEKYPEYLDQVMQIKEEILVTNSAFSLKQLAVNGHDIMALGFKGPDVGKILNMLLENVIDEVLINDKETLINHVKTCILLNKLLGG